MYLSYKQEPTRSFLIQRIQDKKEKGLIPQDKKITENLLIDEQFKYFMSLDEKEYVKKIFNHPGLLDSDHSEIQSIVNEVKMNQAYMSFATFSSTMLFYRLFMRKIPFFYNFFNRKHHKVIKYTKKGVCSFMVYWVQLFGLNYIYDHRIPIIIRDKGLFKKYNIKFDL